jgi:hypothetical protein
MGVAAFATDGGNGRAVRSSTGAGRRDAQPPASSATAIIATAQRHFEFDKTDNEEDRIDAGTDRLS